MSKGSRQTYFVCAHILNENLVTKIVPASSVEEASNVFYKEFLSYPKEIMGPFYKKRSFIVEESRVLKFCNNMESKKAIYNDWVVNAFFLKEPANHAYLIFIKRNDDVKMAIPKGTIIAPISNLRFI